MINKSVKSFIISDTLIYSASSLINVFLTFLVADEITNGRIDIVGFLISYYLVLTGVVGMIYSKYFLPKTTNKQKIAVSTSMVSYGLIISLMGFSKSVLQITIILSALATLNGILDPLRWNIFPKLLDKGKEAYEWSLEGFFSSIAGAITAALGGYFANKVGLPPVFIFFGLFYIVGGVVFYQIVTARTLVERIRSII